MVTQYTESYGSVSSDIQNLIANKVSLLDQYILMQTGQYEFTALIYNPNTKKCIEYIIRRSSSNSYTNYYTVSEAEADFEYKVLNEYYVFSNIGYGRSLELPVYEGVQSHALIIICIILMFAIIFKGAIFKCLRLKRR